MCALTDSARTVKVSAMSAALVNSERVDVKVLVIQVARVAANLVFFVRYKIFLLGYGIEFNYSCKMHNYF